jgi:hypothetical protein
VQGVQTTQFFHLAFHNTVANHSSSGRQLVSLNTDVLTESSAIVAGAGFFALWDNYNLNTAILYSTILASAAIIGMSIFIKRNNIPSQLKVG